MDEKIRVWTKQHKSVRDILLKEGRYVGRKKFIEMDLGEHYKLVLLAYDWLVEHSSNLDKKTKDAEYPIWLSVREESHMKADDNSVSIELMVDKSDLCFINIEKWSNILNYAYLPKDKHDEAKHREFMKGCGLSDTQAVMSRFYPEIRDKIIKSWDRLFIEDDFVTNKDCYAIIWELRKEWIIKII